VGHGVAWAMIVGAAVGIAINGTTVAACKGNGGLVASISFFTASMTWGTNGAARRSPAL
jgi:hypothetical protein